MSAREDMLAAVRAALRGAPSRVPAPRGYRHRAAERDLIDLFVERVEDSGATVGRCSPGVIQAEIAAVLGGRTALVPDGLPWAVPGAVSDTGQHALKLDRVDAAITCATVGIALSAPASSTTDPAKGGACSLSSPTFTSAWSAPSRSSRVLRRAVAVFDPSPAAGVDQRPLGHQRHRARPRRVRPRPADTPRDPVVMVILQSSPIACALLLVFAGIVLGTARSHVGRLLSLDLGASYIGDEGLPIPKTIREISHGKALDADREPCRLAVPNWLRRHGQTGGAACSGLQVACDDNLILAAPGVFFVHLTRSPELIHDRTRERTHQFMATSRSSSQLSELEALLADKQGYSLDVIHSSETLVTALQRRIWPL